MIKDDRLFSYLKVVPDFGIKVRSGRDLTVLYVVRGVLVRRIVERAIDRLHRRPRCETVWAFRRETVHTPDDERIVSWTFVVDLFDDREHMSVYPTPLARPA